MNPTPYSPDDYLTLKKLADEMKSFHNHIGLMHDLDLLRLIGVGEDEMDLYYICIDIRGHKSYHSAVGGFESLQGKLERYEHTNDLFELNGGCATKEFLVEHMEN